MLHFNACYFLISVNSKHLFFFKNIFLRNVCGSANITQNSLLMRPTSSIQIHTIMHTYPPIFTPSGIGLSGRYMYTNSTTGSLYTAYVAWSSKANKARGNYSMIARRNTSNINYLEDHFVEKNDIWSIMVIIYFSAVS